MHVGWFFSKNDLSHIKDFG